MPVSPRLCPHHGQAPASFDSSYRTETSYKKFSSFLNHSIRVSNRQSSESVQFPLIDLLRHLNVQQALLKGSTVYSWKTDQPNADIDLQIHATAESCQHHPEQIIEFLKSRLQRAAGHAQAMNGQTWLSRVSREIREGWHRMIISVGYPTSQDKVTTLDLNFNNQLTVAHDAIHASKAIQFNWAQRKAMILDFWHPDLVKWLCDHQLLWFKPDIENGLGRLSLRLNKSPDAFLLQPHIAAHFAQQASESSLKSICHRVMMDEYPHSRLTPVERQQLWEPVIDVAAQSQDEFLKRDLLAWSKFNTLDQLRDSLANGNTREMVLSRLGKGCQIGADFKNAVKQVIHEDPRICECLKPMMSQALGARLVPGKWLFNRLDRWDQIQDVPETELQTVFTDCLNTLTECGDAAIAQRARHMLGWLVGDDIASIKFWIDRIPESARNDPPEQLIEPVREGLLQIIESQGASGLTPVLMHLEPLRLRQSDWHAIAQALMKAPPTDAAHSTDTTPPCLTLLFVQTLTDNAALLAALIPGSNVQLDDTQVPMPTQQFHDHMMKLAEQLESQKVPPVLRNILSVNRGEIEIRLPELLLGASFGKRTVTASLGQIKHWIHQNSYAVLQPLPAGAGQSLQVMWADGSMFSGRQVSAAHFSFNGHLSQITKPSSQSGITGLLRAGRLLAKNLLHGTDFKKSNWRADGVFNGHSLLRADGLDQALLAIKQGCIRDHTERPTLWIEHHIKDYKPDQCTVIANSLRSSVELNMPYLKPKPAGDDAEVFNNAWHVAPDLNNIQSVCRFTAPPFGEMHLRTEIPNQQADDTQAAFGTVTASKGMSFNWHGRIESGRLLPEGSLFLDKQTKPAIVFSRQTPSANIPLTLLPTMAELLGKHGRGSYRFAPKVWDKAHDWPSIGFEGFVNLLPCGDSLFSGYITSTGQALGVLSQIANPQSDVFHAWTGTFMVRAASLPGYETIALDKQGKQRFAMPLPNQGVLVPHGLVQQHSNHRYEQRPVTRQHQLYFCGENIFFRKISQSDEVQYNHPDLPRYFAGVHYTQNGKPSQLDLVFNPGDGGHDFVIIRPENYQTQKNRQETYRDSQGMRANWLVANHRHEMGQIEFPSGIQYSGQIRLQGDYFKLLGKGKLTLGTLSFTAEFASDDTARNLKGLNPESRHWVQTYGNNDPARVFTLKDWVEVISGGELNWESDMKAHLRCRELSSLKPQATAFSAR